LGRRDRVGGKAEVRFGGELKMKQQEILQELRRHGGSLAVAAANEIGRLAADNAELDKSLGALTTAYNELLDHMPA
jgi:F0F1-type ATP synthase membrane subunit b/b'